MPFAVFRRHQRKLLATTAILAMLGFVLADSLPSLLRDSGGGPRSNSVVVELYGRTVRQADLSELASERSLANAFLANLMQRAPQLFQFQVNPQVFGGTSTAELVDAMILEHEADAMNMPATPELAREWLKRATLDPRTGTSIMDASLFEALLNPFRDRFTGEQVLASIANQIRLMQVQRLPGEPTVTPRDVYRAYLDRYERVSAHAVAVPIADFLAGVPEPSPAEAQSFYDQSKDRLPVPEAGVIGFKRPRQVRVEYVSIDGKALARELEPTITEAELKQSYDEHRQEFALDRSNPQPESLFQPLPDLPVDLFAGDPEAKLTPRRYRPFEEVREELRDELAEEKARLAIERKFGIAQADEADAAAGAEARAGTRTPYQAMLDYADDYADVMDRRQEQEGGAEAPEPLPKRPDLKAIAARLGLSYHLTPPLGREDAEHYGAIGESRVGLTWSPTSRTFAEELFGTEGPRSSTPRLFEPIELSTEPSPLAQEPGRRFLAWKIEDRAPRVPPLDEIRDEVVRAWKDEKARELARKAADDLAAEARKHDGDLRAVAGDRPVITTQPVAKLESTSRFQLGFNAEPRPTEIPEIPKAGPALHDALAGLQPKQVAVAPNAPKTTYYVLTLNQRIPADLAGLYDPNRGVNATLRTEVLMDAQRAKLETWMEQLRARAGLPPNWTPPEEPGGDTLADAR